MEESSSMIELDHAIGYSGFVTDSIFLHPNCKDYVLMTGSNVIISDLADPHKQFFLKGHDNLITCLAISNQGKLLASGQKGENSDVLVWDFESKKILYRLSEHDYEVVTVDFSHDDRLLLTCGSQLDGKLFIWDLSNGYIVATTTIVPLFNQSVTCAKFGGFAKDIKLRATSRYQFGAAGPKKLSVWSLNPHSGELVHDIFSTGTFVRDYLCMAFSALNEEYLYTGTATGDFCSFQIKNKILVFCSNVCSKGVLSIVCCGNDKVCVGGGDGTLAVFFVQDATCQQLCRVDFLGAINGLSSSQDGLQMLTATDKGFVYRVRTHDLSKMLLTETHTKEVVNVFYTPGVSDRFITCSMDGTLRLWDSNDYSAITRCAVFAAGYPMSAYFTDEIILSGWSDGKIRAFRTDNGEPLWTIDNAHKDGVTTIQLSHNQKFIISGGSTGEVRVWEIRSREMVSHLKEHTKKVTKVHVFTDDLYAISCARDNSILCWDLRNERRITSHAQKMGGINSIAVMEDQNLFMSVGQERKITFWDLRKNNPLKIMATSPYGEDDELTGIAISSSNKYFATGGHLGVVRIWECESCNCVAEAKAHGAIISQVAFSPDDKQLISTGNDGLIIIWNLYLS